MSEDETPFQCAMINQIISRKIYNSTRIMLSSEDIKRILQQTEEFGALRIDFERQICYTIIWKEGWETMLLPNF